MTNVKHRKNKLKPKEFKKKKQKEKIIYLNIFIF